jgi:hypothetical protein
VVTAVLREAVAVAGVAGTIVLPIASRSCTLAVLVNWAVTLMFRLTVMLLPGARLPRLQRMVPTKPEQDPWLEAIDKGFPPLVL